MRVSQGATTWNTAKRQHHQGHSTNAKAQGPCHLPPRLRGPDWATAHRLPSIIRFQVPGLASCSAESGKKFIRKNEAFYLTRTPYSCFLCFLSNLFLGQSWLWLQTGYYNILNDDRRQTASTYFQSTICYLRKLDTAAGPLGEMVTGGRHPSLLATSKYLNIHLLQRHFCLDV